MIEVPGMKFEVIGMYGDRRILEIDDYFHSFAFRAGGKIQQRVFVELELRQDTFNARVCFVGHSTNSNGSLSYCAEPKIDKYRTADPGDF
jgi:hypothetical protein